MLRSAQHDNVLCHPEGGTTEGSRLGLSGKTLQWSQGKMLRCAQHDSNSAILHFAFLSGYPMKIFIFAGNALFGLCYHIP